MAHYGLIPVVAVSALLATGPAHAKWSSISLGDVGGQKVCSFADEPVAGAPDGQPVLDGWLAAYLPGAHLRLSFGTLGPRPGLSVDDAVEEALVPMQPAVLTLRFSDGVTLKVSSKQNRAGADVFLQPKEVTLWTHELITARSMDVMGEYGLSLYYDLAGAPNVIQEMVKCVIDNRIDGLPKPFGKS